MWMPVGAILFGLHCVLEVVLEGEIEIMVMARGNSRVSRF